MFKNDPSPHRVVALGQPVSKAAYDYWNALRNSRPLPWRREIEPGGLKGLLPHVMVLERTRPHDIFRLAGTAVCAAFGRELRDHSLQSLWDERQRGALDAALTRSIERNRAVALRLRAHALSRRPLAGEMMLLPALDDQGLPRRWLGSFSFTPDALEPRAFIRLELLEIIAIAPARDRVELMPGRSALPRPALSLVQTRASSKAAARAASPIRPWSGLLEGFLLPKD